MTADAESSGDPMPGMVRRRIEVWVWVCERCGHEWVPRNTTQAPKVCPECKSPYWDRPRTRRQPSSKRPM